MVTPYAPKPDYIAKLHENIRAGKYKKFHTTKIDESLDKKDFYEISYADTALKDLAATMEAPIYSLSKNKDTDKLHWVSANGKKWIVITPDPELGRATIFDHDLIIYITSCLVNNKNNGQSPSKIVRFRVYDYLIATGKSTGGSEYLRVETALKRLYGTDIETNITTGKKLITSRFRLVESYKLVKEDGELTLAEVKLSDWIFNGLDNFDVFTLHRSYFKLKKPLERRLYSIARKHCSNKSAWSIGIENLTKNSGSRSTVKEFKRMLNEIIKADTLPDYRILISGKCVKFYQKDPKKYAEALQTERKKKMLITHKGIGISPTKYRFSPTKLSFFTHRSYR